MEITIKLVIDDPAEGNTIFINVSDSRPSHIAEFSPLGARIHGYQFSAERHPAEWIDEALESVATTIKSSHHSFSNDEKIGLTSDQAVQAITAYAKELDYSAYGGFNNEVARQLAKAFHHRAIYGDWPE